jgi:hypothetical protein
MNNLPKDAPVIATDKAKWDRTTREVGLRVGPGQAR